MGKHSGRTAGSALDVSHSGRLRVHRRAMPSTLEQPDSARLAMGNSCTTRHQCEQLASMHKWDQGKTWKNYLSTCIISIISSWPASWCRLLEQIFRSFMPWLPRHISQKLHKNRPHESWEQKKSASSSGIFGCEKAVIISSYWWEKCGWKPHWLRPLHASGVLNAWRMQHVP